MLCVAVIHHTGVDTVLSENLQNLCNPTYAICSQMHI